MKTAMEQGYEDAMLLLGRVYLEMEVSGKCQIHVSGNICKRVSRVPRPITDWQCVIFMMVHMIAHWRISHRV